MAVAARGPAHWMPARLTESRSETATARTLVLRVDDWPGHLAGQHVDVQLTARDGYSTRRTYSLAAPARGNLIELTVQLLENGEVSPYLCNDYDIGDTVEVRGPLGGWFIWDSTVGQPILAVAGGSGVVPVMAMLRARRDGRNSAPFRLIYSVRRPEDVFYSAELEDSSLPGITVSTVYTRAVPDGWPRPPHRITACELPRPADPETRVYVCGPTAFVDTVTTSLIELGYDASNIRTELFGPSGD